MIKVICTDSYEALCKQVSRVFAAQITLKPNSTLGLATGSTPIGVYSELAQMVAEGRLSLSQVQTLNLDEYVGLGAEDDQSYRYFMNHQLFDRVDIDKSRTHVPNGLAQDPQAEAARYEQLVASMGGVDIQLLGIGNNGHIGFNEPCDHFPMQTHTVALTESTIQANARFFADASQVPTQAITMGIGTIFAAKKIILMANGPKKAQILLDTVAGPVTPQVPASILQLHPDATVYCDAEAGALLRQHGLVD